jgi:hypothetical protein
MTGPSLWLARGFRATIGHHAQSTAGARGIGAAMPTAPRIATAAEVAESTIEISPAVMRPLPNSCIATNLATVSGRFGQHLLDDVYPARTAVQGPVVMARLAPGTRLVGGGHFVVATNGALLAEQVLPGSDLQDLAKLMAAIRPTAEVPDDCLLVARWGIHTWGHWLGELLPRAAVIEARYPGRFRYAVPGPVVSEPSQVWPRIRESLAYFGIAESRLLALDSEQDYRFRALHVVDGVWSDHVPHPHVTECMLRAAPHGADPAHKLYLRRSDAEIRSLVNAPAVEETFIDAGYTAVTIGTLPFSEQVRLFASSSHLGGVLGSNLTGLMFAPVGVNVVTLAPALFGDRFFYGLVQTRLGTMVDVRGPTSGGADPAVKEGNRSFSIDVDELRSFLHLDQ